MLLQKLQTKVFWSSRARSAIFNFTLKMCYLELWYYLFLDTLQLKFLKVTYIEKNLVFIVKFIVKSDGHLIQLYVMCCAVD